MICAIIIKITLISLASFMVKHKEPTTLKGGLGPEFRNLHADAYITQPALFA